MNQNLSYKYAQYNLKTGLYPLNIPIREDVFPCFIWTKDRQPWNFPWNPAKSQINKPDIAIIILYPTGWLKTVS